MVGSPLPGRDTFRKCGFRYAGLARGKKVLKKKTLNPEPETLNLLYL